MSADSKPHSIQERPEWIRTARYTFLQSAPWTPIQECLNEACLAYDGLVEQLEAAKEGSARRRRSPAAPGSRRSAELQWASEIARAALATSEQAEEEP